MTSIYNLEIGNNIYIGKNVTIGHLVMLHGCTIGDNSLIGIGAVILNKANICLLYTSPSPRD